MPRSLSARIRRLGKGDVAGQNRRASRKRLRRIRALIDAAKLGGCSMCPETHPACMDFHHLDPSHKKRDVSRSKTETALRNELAKCVRLCANCHRKLHAAQDRHKRDAVHSQPNQLELLQ